MRWVLLIVFSSGQVPRRRRSPPVTTRAERETARAKASNCAAADTMSLPVTVSTDSMAVRKDPASEAKQLLGVQVSHLSPVILADCEPLEEFPRSVQRKERVIDRPDDPVGADDLIDELEVREAEHAAWRNPDLAPVDLADGARQAGDCRRHNVVEALQVEGHHLSPVPADDLEFRKLLEGPG